MIDIQKLDRYLEVRQIFRSQIDIDNKKDRELESWIDKQLDKYILRQIERIIQMKIDRERKIDRKIESKMDRGKKDIYRKIEIKKGQNKLYPLATHK